MQLLKVPIYGAVGRRDSENCLEHVRRKKLNMDPKIDGVAAPMTLRESPSFSKP